jgi:hypothetical protein
MQFTGTLVLGVVGSLAVAAGAAAAVPCEGLAGVTLNQAKITTTVAVVIFA